MSFQYISNERYPSIQYCNTIPTGLQVHPLWLRMSSEAFHSRTLPVSQSSVPEDVHAPLPRCPTFFPPHSKTRKRTRGQIFSEFWILAAEGGRKLTVPQKLILRNYTQSDAYSSIIASQGRFLVGDVINPSLVIVLGVLNKCGQFSCGWYKQHHHSKRRLQRMSRHEMEQLRAEMDKCDNLCESTLCNRLLDSSLRCPNPISISELDHLVSESCLSTLVQFQKHARMHTTLEGVFQLPDQSKLPTGSCQICMKDEECPLYHTACCGEAGAVCLDCLKELKHLCPICDREFVNASYMCAGCKTELAFKDFGFPCVDCNKCVLCESCYHTIESCTACIDDNRARQRNKKKCVRE